MQFAGLNYVFIRAIMYTGGGGGRYRKKLRLMSSVQDKGRTQDLGHSFFFYYKDLHRPLIIFFSWNCSFEFGKKKRKEEHHAYKISCRFVEGFFVWM